MFWSTLYFWILKWSVSYFNQFILFYFFHSYSLMPFPDIQTDERVHGSASEVAEGVKFLGLHRAQPLFVVVMLSETAV